MSERYSYIGESSRSLFERSREHWTDAEKLKESSHIARHWASCHPDSQDPPPFRFKVVKKHKRALARQIHEAVRINDKGNLNDKLEWRINTIDRLGTKLNKREEDALRVKEERNKKDREREMGALRERLRGKVITFSSKGGSGNRGLLSLSNKTFFDFRQEFSCNKSAEKRDLAEAAEAERCSKRRKKVDTGHRSKMNSPPAPESDNSGFTGDTTTSWDQAAFDEVLKAEEILQQQRWSEIIKDWYGEIK